MLDNKKTIAVFDVDNTLLKGDLALFLIFDLLNIWELIFCSIKIFPYFIMWKVSLIQTKKFKEKFYRDFKVFQIINKKKLLEDKLWIKKILIKNINKKALDRLNFHKCKRHKVILCSASPNFLLEPLAEYLDVELLATNFKNLGGNYIPLIVGKNCNGIEKVIRLQSLINLKEYSLHVYGDSKGDKDLLEIADFPHYRSFSKDIKDYPKYPYKTLIYISLLSVFIYLFLVLITNAQFSIDLIIANRKSITGSLLLVSLSYLLRFYRWRLLMKSFSINIPILKDAKIWISSYAFTATPGKVGESIRCLFLKNKFDIPIDISLSALIAERISDFISVLVIAIINLNQLLNLEIINLNNFNNAINFLLIIFFIFFIFFIFKKNIFIFFVKFIPKVFKNKLSKVFLTTKKLFNIKNILISTLLGVLAWSIEGLGLFILLKGFFLNSIVFLDAIFIHTFAGLIGALSFSPGGLGTTELGTIGLLRIYNVPLPIAADVTLIMRIMTIWYATVLGLVCLFFNRNE